jgi:hypothetical protein
MPGDGLALLGVPVLALRLACSPTMAALASLAVLPGHLGGDAQGKLQFLVARRLPGQEIASCLRERVAGEDAQDC